MTAMTMQMPMMTEREARMFERDADTWDRAGFFQRTLMRSMNPVRAQQREDASNQRRAMRTMMGFGAKQHGKEPFNPHRLSSWAKLGK